MQPDLNRQLYDAIVDQNIEAISTLIEHMGLGLTPVLFLAQAWMMQHKHNLMKIKQNYWNHFMRYSIKP